MKSFMNLLPEPYKRSESLRQCLRFWLTVYAIAVAGLSCHAAWSWRRYESTHDLAANWEAEYEPLNRLQRRIQQVQRQILDTRQRQSLVRELATEQPLITLLGLVSQAAHGCEGKVAVKKLHFTRDHQNTARPRRIELQGWSVDQVSIARFVALLRESGRFREISLVSTGVGQLHGKEVHDYHVHCYF